MECICRKFDRPEITNASLAILTVEISLDDLFPVLENKKPMDIPHAPLHKRLIEPSDHLGCEFVWRDHGPQLPKAGKIGETITDAPIPESIWRRSGMAETALI